MPYGPWALEDQQDPSENNWRVKSNNEQQQQISSPNLSPSREDASMEEQKISGMSIGDSVSQFGRQKVDKLFGTRMLGLKLGDKGRPFGGQQSVNGQRLNFLELVRGMQVELNLTDDE